MKSEIGFLECLLREFSGDSVKLSADAGVTSIVPGNNTSVALND